MQELEAVSAQTYWQEGRCDVTCDIVVVICKFLRQEIRNVLDNSTVKLPQISVWDHISFIFYTSLCSYRPEQKFQRNSFKLHVMNLGFIPFLFLLFLPRNRTHVGILNFPSIRVRKCLCKLTVPSSKPSQYATRSEQLEYRDWTLRVNTETDLQAWIGRPTRTRSQRWVPLRAAF